MNAASTTRRTGLVPTTSGPVIADAVDFVDTDGHRLGLRRTASDAVALARRDLRLPGGLTARCEILAASHRVTVLDDAGHALLVEEVSCAGGGGPLPATDACGSAGGRGGGGTWHFESSLTASPDLSALSRRIERATWRSHDVLAVRFPGHRDAMTALARTPRGWRTWHLYPGPDAHVVRTRTSLDDHGVASTPVRSR